MERESILHACGEGFFLKEEPLPTPLLEELASKKLAAFRLSASLFLVF
jgi:hypothetical protein